MVGDVLGSVRTQYVDRPDLNVSYVDSVGSCTMNLGVFRVEFQSIRVNEPKPGRKGPLTGQKYPVARIAMPIPVVIELYNNLTNVMGVLAKQGLVTKGKDGMVPTNKGTSTIQ